MPYEVQKLFTVTEDGQRGATVDDSRLRDTENAVADDATVADWSTTTTFRYIQWRPLVPNTTDAGATPFTPNGRGWNVLRSDMDRANPAGGTNVTFTNTKRVTPAGVWEFRLTWSTTADATAANGDYRTRVTVGRLKADNTYERLFDTERTYTVAEIPAVMTTFTFSSASQPKYTFADDETLHVEWHVRGRGLAITGRTATFRITNTDGNEAYVQVPSPGIRSEFFGTLTMVGRAVGAIVRKTKKPVTAAARGIVTIVRKTKKPLSDAARGIATIVRKTGHILPTVVARGIPAIVRKTGHILPTVRAAGVTSMVRKTKKPVTAVARGITTLTRRLTLFRTLAPAARGIATVTKKTGHIVPTVAARGAATLVRRTKKPLATSGRAIGSLVRKIKKPVTARARGIAVVNKQPKKLLQAAARGIATITRQLRFRRTLEARARGVAKGRVEMPFERVPGDGGGTTVIKKIIAIFDD